MTYTAPIDDMMFNLTRLAGFDGIRAADELDPETVRAILDEAARLAGEVLAPLNKSGDDRECTLDDGAVTTPEGFRQAYARYREGGWNALAFDPDYGGQGLPWLMAFPVQEMWQAANMAFGLCPMLNQGAVESITRHGSAQQKQAYLPKLISGEWAGTMNLTESQSGSDLSTIRTIAEIQDDGAYRLRGEKIYITYGEHDFTDNIIHLVLARTPDSPEGVKGISLFIVPKYLADETGEYKIRNDVYCSGIEKKLGIHASPTCTMKFGEQEGATAYLVGEENQGLRYMFTMMNNARISVGLQGVALADRAYQLAFAYAAERVQGRELTGDNTNPVPIGHHPDVRRMLGQMRSMTEAGRALTYRAAYYMDLARQGDEVAAGFVELLTPVVKAWCTDMAEEVASLGIQVHGGMGFIEESGAPQHYRDARILSIYEGTNGIQAHDLVFRKIIKDGGKVMRAWLARARESLRTYKLSFAPEDMAGLGEELARALDGLEHSVTCILEEGDTGRLDRAASVASPFLCMAGTIAGGLMMAESAVQARALEDEEDESGSAPLAADEKYDTAALYAGYVLPRWRGQARTVETGMDAVCSEP